jgi:hypothetical protein
MQVAAIDQSSSDQALTYKTEIESELQTYCWGCLLGSKIVRVLPYENSKMAESQWIVA